jgi:hypothetical protein
MVRLVFFAHCAAPCLSCASRSTLTPLQQPTHTRLQHTTQLLRTTRRRFSSCAHSAELTDAVEQMIKRLQIPNPNVQLQTVKLLSSCVANCGRPFRVALCSKAFATELRRVLNPNRGNNVHQKVQNELKAAAVEWRGFFAGDPQLHIIDTTLTELARQGVNLTVTPASDAPGGKDAEARKAREKEEEEHLSLATTWLGGCMRTAVRCTPSLPLAFQWSCHCPCMLGPSPLAQPLWCLSQVTCGTLHAAPAVLCGMQ